MNDLQNVVREYRAKQLFNSRISHMVLLTLDVITLYSTIRPKCLCDIHVAMKLVELLIKEIGGCITFLTSRAEIASGTCLDGSGIKFIFHWKGYLFILSKSSQSCLAVAFASFIIVNKERSSVKSFGFD